MLVSRSARSRWRSAVAAPGPAEHEEAPPVPHERHDERKQPAEDDEGAHLPRPHSRSHPARPSSRRKPQTSVKVVTKIDEAIAGSMPVALEHDRDERAGEPGHEEIARHGEEDDEAERGSGRP